MTINQLLQKRVEESKRGTIGGMQLGHCMSIIQFFLVMLLAQPETFGLVFYTVVLASGFSHTTITTTEFVSIFYCIAKAKVG